MYFEYLSIRGHVGPYIPVVLNDSYSTFGMIDSGADTLVISKRIARRLGVPLETTRIVQGIGGPQQVFDAVVTIMLFADTLRTLQVPCRVVDAEIPVLIGRAGFFDAFDIVFHQSGGIFAIEDAA